MSTLKKLKLIKKELRKAKVLNEHNERFAHKDMRLIFSYVSITFKEDADIASLVKTEIELTKVKIGPKMFVKAFSSLSKTTDKNIDWKSFGEFMWFIFQTSTYWKDSKKGIKNIFNKKNFVDKNKQKRDLYNNWMRSIPTSTPDYNQKLMNVMKRVF